MAQCIIYKFRSFPVNNVPVVFYISSHNCAWTSVLHCFKSCKSKRFKKYKSQNITDLIHIIHRPENISTIFPIFCFASAFKFLIWCWLHFTQDGLAIYFVVFGGSVEHPWDILNFRRAPIGKTNSAMFFLVLTENAVVMLNFWQLSISFPTTANMHSFSKQN